MRSVPLRQLTGLWPLRPQPQGEALFAINDLRTRPRGENEARIRGLCASAYLGQDVALCRALGRYKMFVDSRDRGLSPHLILDGYWEMWVTEVMARRVRPGMTVADVGANVGYFTLLLADLVGPGGAVHAFEPNPGIVELLRQNLAVNGFDATIHPIALSDTNGGLVRLIVPPNEPKNAHIVPCDPHEAGASTDPMILTTHRLDSLAALQAVDFLKIDADTAEEAIWRGMSGILEGGRAMTVILEFAPARYADPRGFLAAISSCGFSLAVIDRAAGERAATVDDILAGAPTEDRMLLLCR
ncbi:MAG: FkbM family methyltransferase [Caulobacteraceae bacterium]